MKSKMFFGALLVTGLALQSVGLGQDFRVDTEIFIGTEKEPVAESLTLFYEGRVYDFLLTGSKEITIYDPSRGQFTLLDTERSMKSVVSTQQLLKYADDMAADIARSGDPLMVAISTPKFETKVQEFQENGEPRVRVTMTSKEISYQVVGIRPKKTEAVPAYRQACDYFARFNAARPGNLPPGSRLALDKVLADNGVVPLEIQRTIVTPGLGSKTLEVRSRHLFNWILSNEDRKKIDAAGTNNVTFAAVDFEEHRSMGAKPPASVAAQPGVQKKRN